MIVVYAVPFLVCLMMLGSCGCLLQPGSKLTMTVDTRSSAALKPGGAAKAEDTAAEMLVELAYLR
jgi:hypothetical protein